MFCLLVLSLYKFQWAPTGINVLIGSCQGSLIWDEPDFHWHLLDLNSAFELACTYTYRLREGGCRTSKLASSFSRELAWRDQSPWLFLSQKQALPPMFSYLCGFGTECSFPCSDQEDDEGLALRGDNENALVMNPSGDVLIGLAFSAKKLSRGHPLFKANICTIRTDFTFPAISTPPPTANVLNTFPENTSLQERLLSRSPTSLLCNLLVWPFQGKSVSNEAKRLTWQGPHFQTNTS